MPTVASHAPGAELDYENNIEGHARRADYVGVMNSLQLLRPAWRRQQCSRTNTTEDKRGQETARLGGLET